MTMGISVVGTGYLGATHAACLAELGFEALGVDSDRTKVARLARSVAPVHVSDPATEVDHVSQRARHRVVRAAEELCGPDLTGVHVAVLRAAFKPLSDDVRDSRALEVATQPHRRGAARRVYDQEASNNARSVAPQLTYDASVQAALTGADLVLHLTDWPQFCELDPAAAARLVPSLRLVEARNRLDVERWRLAGWTVRWLGRPSAAAATTPARSRVPSPLLRRA